MGTLCCTANDLADCEIHLGLGSFPFSFPTGADLTPWANLGKVAGHKSLPGCFPVGTDGAGGEGGPVEIKGRVEFGPRL